MKKKAAKRVKRTAAPRARAGKAVSQKSDTPPAPKARRKSDAAKRAAVRTVTPVEKAAGLAAAVCGDRPLPPRQQQFVAGYLANGLNASQAAISAGYSAKTAASMGSRLLRNVKVAAVIAELTAAKLDKLDYSIERTLREVARLAFFDPLKLYRPDGELKPIDEIDEDTRSVIAGLESYEDYVGHGDEREAVGRVRKVKITDRRAALDMLMRYHSLYKDKVEHSGKLTLESLVLGADAGD